MTTNPPTFSQHIKPGAKIIALAMVIENPNGEQVMVLPVEVSGQIDVITDWEGVPFGSNYKQRGRATVDFETMAIWKTQPGDGKPDGPGVYLPGMEYKVV